MGGPRSPLIIDLQVVPRASRVAVGGRVGERLRVAVTAPPVDGAANAAVAEALAAAFGVRTRDVAIVRGQTGRRKTAQISGGSPEILTRLLDASGGHARGQNVHPDRDR